MLNNVLCTKYLVQLVLGLGEGRQGGLMQSPGELWILSFLGKQVSDFAPPQCQNREELGLGDVCLFLVKVLPVI